MALLIKKTTTSKHSCRESRGVSDATDNNRLISQLQQKLDKHAMLTLFNHTVAKQAFQDSIE